MSGGNPDLACRRVVEIASDYLEGALVPEERARFEQHLLLCEGCVNYLEQTRATLRALGRLGGGPVSAASRDAALRAFRALRKGSAP
jgi:hypothetical protein